MNDALKEGTPMHAFIERMIAQGGKVKKTHYGYLLTLGGSDGVPRDEFERAMSMATTGTSRTHSLAVIVDDPASMLGHEATISKFIPDELSDDQGAAVSLLQLRAPWPKRVFIDRDKGTLTLGEQLAKDVAGMQVRMAWKHMQEELRHAPRTRPFTDEAWRRNGKRKGKRK